MRRSTIGLVMFAAVGLAGCRSDVSAPTRPLTQGAQQHIAGADGASAFQIISTPQGDRPSAPPAAASTAGPPTALSGIVSVGSGNAFSCALRNDGLVYCWGGGAPLGNGSLVGSRTPVEVSGPDRFSTLVVGDANACGLTSTGAAYCWGDNRSGQLGIGTVSSFSLVPVAVSGGRLFTTLSIGLRSMCGVATDATTYCWGNNVAGQLGIGIAGPDVTIPTAVVNSASLGFTAVSAGFFASCALTAAGATYCWGQGAYLGNGTNVPASLVPTPAASGRLFARMDMGSLYGCGVGTAGRAYCWGSQASGDLGNGSFATPVLTPTLVASGATRFTTVDANGMNSFIAFTCGLSTLKDAWCWGANDQGQLGAPGASTCTFGSLTYNCSAVPLRVSGGRKFRQVAVGLGHACAMDGSAQVFCWGDNRSGQLGNGSLVSSSTPVRVVQLIAPPQDGSVVVSPLSGTLNLIGSTLQFSAQALDENGVPLPVQPSFRWFTSNAAAVTVDGTGRATAVASGSAIITARTKTDQFGHAPVTVNIIDPSLAFVVAWSGGNRSGIGTSDGLVVVGGLLADEWRHSDTFPTRLELDMRAISATNSQLVQWYGSLALARTALEWEIARLQLITPNDPLLGQYRALVGYIYLGIAESFCSGVPLDDPNLGLTTADLFTLADARFAQTLAGPVVAPYDVMAHLGQARARLGMGNFAGAAAAAASVPTPFRFGTSHSATSGAENTVYSLNAVQRRLTLADVEGGNGLPFRSAADSRLPWVASGFGFDAQTPSFVALKYRSTADSIFFASGTEARLIEAEAALRFGNVSAYLNTLNALRVPAGLPALADPGTQLARENLLFSERAFWLFGTGSRLGDVRRLIGSYGRAASTVLPVGAYPKGGSYGTDANLPVPASVRGPSYAGCTDRTS